MLKSNKRLRYLRFFFASWCTPFSSAHFYHYVQALYNDHCFYLFLFLSFCVCVSVSLLSLSLYLGLSVLRSCLPPLSVSLFLPLTLSIYIYLYISFSLQPRCLFVLQLHYTRKQTPIYKITASRSTLPRNWGDRVPT